MCTLSVLFAYKVGLFNIGASGQYAVGAGFALYFAIHFNGTVVVVSAFLQCLALAGLGAGFLYLSGIEQWSCAQTAVPNMGFNGIAAAFLGGIHPIGAIFSSFFIQHITSGGAYVDKMVYCSQISDLIAAIIIYFCGFVLFFKHCMNRRFQKAEEKRAKAEQQAADSVGINVYKMRYIGVLISGFLGGLGGIVYITAGVSEWKFENGVAGFGFLALAVMIFGQWRPNLIALTAVLFGLFRALSNVYSGFDFLASLNIPTTFYKMLPYIISLLVLALFSKNSRAPKAEGIPYDKGQR